MEWNHIVFYLIVFCIDFIENHCDLQVNEHTELICERRRRCYNENIIDNKTINCENSSISDITSYPDSGETSLPYPFKLQVYDSEIPILPTSAFKTLRAVSALDLEHIKLEKLLPGAFNFLDGLRKLSLKGNKLSELSDGIFNSLTKLETLDVSSNSITNITDHALVGGALKYIDLSNNSILHLSQVLLDSFTHLLHLNVSHNNLSETNSYLNSHLRTLDASYNNIHKIDFIRLLAISDSIDFSSNNVSEILNFNESSAAQINLSNNSIVYLQKNENVLNLNVSYNRMETIDGDLLGHKLQIFDASHNLISSIETSAFFRLFNLRSLFLNNNNLSSIPNGCFNDLTSLNHLNLSGNKITYFSFGTFDQLVELRTLDISDNNLQSLNQYTFHSMENLKELSFRHNEISDINVEDLILHMPNITGIKLDGNTWPCTTLIRIVHALMEKNISISKGNLWNQSNVYGIECFGNLDKTGSVHDVNSSFSNEDLKNSAMYKYFNQDFKDSNFFKYLESLNIAINNQSEMLSQSGTAQLITDSKTKSNLNFTETLMYNYFNTEFKNSSFYKYLESFRDQTENKQNSKRIPDSNLEEVITLLKEILESSSKTNAVQTDYSKNDYFNEGFKNTSFFKFLESLGERDDTQSDTDHLSASQMERLISNFKIETNSNSYPSYTGMISFISILIILSVCVIIIGNYFLINLLKKHIFLKQEHVELI